MASIGERLQRLEDERAIRRMIDLNWFLADAGPAAAFTDLYTEDCVIDLGRLVTPDADTIVEGHAGVAARYTDQAHSQWEGRSHHLSAGPEAILVEGDDASALTYAITTMLIDGAPKRSSSGSTSGGCGAAPAAGESRTLGAPSRRQRCAQAVPSNRRPAARGPRLISRTATMS